MYICTYFTSVRRPGVFVCLCRAKTDTASISIMYVRAPFVPPTVEEFMVIFEQPESQIKPFRGGSLGDISVYRPYDNYRRGAGLLSFLGNIGKRLIPFVSKLVKPALLDFGSGVIDDMRQGNDSLRSSLKKRGVEAVKHIGARAMRGGGGGGGRGVRRKRKRVKRLTIRPSCSSYKKDVFSLA